VTKRHVKDFSHYAPCEEGNHNESSAGVVQISTSSTVPRTKKRRGLFLFQLFIVVGFLAAVWFSFGQNVLTPQKQMSVPERLQTLELVNTIEGGEALSGISRLHGTDIKLETAYIAEYAVGTERATVWVGRAESRDAAADLTMRMIEGIEKGGSGFSNLQRLTVAGHEVFQVDGPGGEHFFYVSREQGERIVWLTVETADALPILEQTVKNF
jgi:hypothetical protein